MKAALSDPAESERRAAAGRKMVCSEFARDIVFDRLERLLARGSNTAATGNFTTVS
jgi:hypothetical protein